MAATTLGKAGSTARQATDSLIERLQDEDEHVRAAAATALGEIAPADAAVQSALVEAMKDESGRVRGSVALVLAEHAPVTKEMIQVGYTHRIAESAREIAKAAATTDSQRRIELIGESLSYAEESQWAEGR